MSRKIAAPPVSRKAPKRRARISSVKSRSRQAIPSDLVMQALAVFDGQRCLGHLLSRGKLGVEAYDASDSSLGIFPNQKAAADAVSDAAGRAM
jgi:hypothetical protein